MVVLRGAVQAAILAAGQATARAGDLAREVLGDEGYQKDLPAPAPPTAPRTVELPELGFLRFVLYAAVLVAVALAAVWLARFVLTRRERDVALPPEAAPAPLQVELEGPERLAAAGRWAEAIHALLLETLAALSRAARLAPSYTSREILERVRLPLPAREALEALVLAVEISRFGGVPAGEAEYRSCLDRFHQFLDTYRRPAREAA
ncbi:MAG TPA: DUF4129 domain-containing protein [Anaeromyxobacter sp.]|nr:DUF4129 domain-containing protein [Anaeromyxobacter sp.]